MTATDNRTVQWTGEYRAGVTLIYYRRDGEHEELHIPGPSLEDLRFLVFVLEMIHHSLLGTLLLLSNLTNAILVLHD